MLTFCIEFLPLLLWLPLRVRGPQENHEDYAQFRFCRFFLFLSGEKAGGLLGGVREADVAGGGGSGEGGGGPCVFSLNIDSQGEAGGGG